MREGLTLKRKWWIGLALALWIATLPGCGSQEAEPLRFVGSVEADQVDISPEVAGIILSVQAADGAAVKKGDILMTLDMSDYDIKLQKAEKALAQAVLKAEDLRSGSSGNLIRQARANLENVAAQIDGSLKELEYLDSNLEKARALFDSGVLSKTELDETSRLRDREQAKYQALQKQKDAMAAALGLAVEGVSSETLKSAELEIDMRQLEIDELKRTMGKGILNSPLEGVVQSVNYQAGERIAPGQRSVTLLDLSQLTIKIYVPEKELYRLRLGMPAEFAGAFAAGQGIGGSVTYISSEAEFTPKNIESRENKQEMVYEVRILVQDPAGIIKPGMFLDVLLKEGAQ